MDVLLMDLSMPGQSGIDALVNIRAKSNTIRILILSGYPEEQYAMNVMRMGANGYLNKECEPEEIVKAIRLVAQGRDYVSPTMADLLLQQLNRTATGPQHEQLSEREMQVFLHLAKGESVTNVAETLSLSVKTVSTYRTRIMEKMKADGRTIILISEELPELIGMSDRLLIMKDGKITKEFQRSKELSDRDIINYMI